MQSNENLRSIPVSHITIHTDGACQGNPGPGAYAAIIKLWNSGSVVELPAIVSSVCDTTNNRMELSAAIAGLSVIPGLNIEDTSVPITLFSDSKYVIDGMSRWLKSWKANSWRTSAKEPVKNRDLWEQLDAVAADLSVKWSWVKGHAGDPDNEAADALASRGLESYLSAA